MKESRWHSPPSMFAVFAILLAELLALGLLQLPASMQFDRFGFGDQGANLTVQYLLAIGYKPNVDFFYPYGLLSLLCGRVWFGLLGPSPVAYQVAMLGLAVLTILGIARLASHLNVGGVGLAVLVTAIGYAVTPTYSNFAHAVEAALICNALAEQARGRRSIALALVCAAGFAKPSMAYFYGLVLLLLMLWNLRLTRVAKGREALRLIMPALGTTAILLIVLTATYGIVPVSRTVLPLAGSKIYSALHYGFFSGLGRDFWHPPGARWTYYLGTAAGFWLASTVYLIIAGVAALAGLIGVTTNPRRLRISHVGEETIGTCAVLHIAFVTIFFGNAWSWPNYSYILVVGVAVASERSLGFRYAACGLCLLALLGYKSMFAQAAALWRTNSRSPETAGLWASPEEHQEWSRVLSLARDRPAVILDGGGAASLLFPQFEKPVSLFLRFPKPISLFVRPGHLPSEVDRKLSQLSRASTTVVPLMYPYAPFLEQPPFSRALAQYDAVWQGRYFKVWQRAKSARREIRP